jgi:hypothetical protein
MLLTKYQNIIFIHISIHIFLPWPSQWPRNIRYELSSLARTLGSWVRIVALLTDTGYIDVLIIILQSEIITHEDNKQSLYWLKPLHPIRWAEKNRNHSNFSARHPNSTLLHIADCNWVAFLLPSGSGKCVFSHYAVLQFDERCCRLGTKWNYIHQCSLNNRNHSNFSARHPNSTLLHIADCNWGAFLLLSGCGKWVVSNYAVLQFDERCCRLGTKWNHIHQCSLITEIIPISRHVTLILHSCILQIATELHFCYSLGVGNGLFPIMRCCNSMSGVAASTQNET